MKDFLIYFGRDLKKHFFDYLVLVTSGVVFLFFLRVFQGQKFLSFITLLTFVALYIIWGVYHHTSTKTLHFKNVIEYILIGFTILVFLKTFIIIF